MASISLKRLNKTYGPLTVVHDIDLEIADKEFIILVGPSGCGKSTTLRMIAGLEEISGESCGSVAISSTMFPPGTGTSRWCSRTMRSIRI